MAGARSTVAEDRAGTPSGGDEGLRLVVMGPQTFATHALPAAGELVLGRGEEADLVLDDPLVSRRHARLRVAPGPTGAIEIEDLGSANGTVVREARLAPGDRAPVWPGEAIGIGALTLMVRGGRPASSTALEDDGVGPAMRQVLALADRAAGSGINVLVLGETGVGKEVLARRIHDRSARAGRPFVALHGAALSEALLESELFGHEKGAFTGAAQAKPGLLETAPGGTVFLDELGELPPSLQAKLLRVVERREVIRVGGLAPRPIDVRFVAATNRHLEAEVARGAFRQDLYFRLNGITLVVPPLRERRGEIAGLAARLLGELARAERRPPPRLGAAARAALEAYAFPGNVRELRNVLERALLLCDGPELAPAHLGLGPGPAPDEVPALAAGAANRGADGDDRGTILEALAACAGNQSRAAKRLGISRKALIARLDALGLPRPRKGRP